MAAMFCWVQIPAKFFGLKQQKKTLGVFEWEQKPNGPLL